MKIAKFLLLVVIILQSQTSISQNHYPSSGNVGIGTLSPSYGLDVNNSWALRSTGYFYNATAYSYESSTDSYLGFRTMGGVGNIWMEGNKPMVFQPSGGHVGIGMSAPQDRLHVADGNIRIGTDTGDYGQIYYLGGAMGIYNKWIDDDAYIRLGAGNELNAMNIMGNGNVGIGITVPQDLLHIADGNIRIGTDAGDYGEINYSGGGMAIYNKWESDNAYLWLGVGNDINAMIIMGNGQVGIGLNGINPCTDCKLDVDGKIRSEEVKVEVVNAPDYVFEDDYELRTLKETKAYIEQNKHLPEIPAGRDMEADGVDLGVMNMMLLKKIEEMTLHQIELMERLEEVESSNEEMSQQINALQAARN